MNPFLKNSQPQLQPIESMLDFWFSNIKYRRHREANEGREYEDQNGRTLKDFRRYLHIRWMITYIRRCALNFISETL